MFSRRSKKNLTDSKILYMPKDSALQRIISYARKLANSKKI